jgi:LysR family transcriptional regulator, low CO2-responsive transcriptional regulator
MPASKGAQGKTLIQLPYLDTFSEAAEQSSFTAAGKTLGMTQAAVSQRIQALEKMLGKSLFLRSGTRIRLTEAGQQLYGYAQQILRIHGEAFETITGRRTPVSGELMIAASSVPGQHLLPDVLNDFRKKFPQIRVRATILDSLAAIHEVEKGNVHLGVVGRKIDSPHLEFRPFASDEMVLVIPDNHSWQERRTISFKQFARQPLILREPGSGSRWCFENALSDSGKRYGEMNVVLELGGNEAIKEAVLKGMGVAILSSMAVKKELESGELHALRISGLSLERTMYIVLDTQRVLPLSARMFLQVVLGWDGSDNHAL